MKTYTSDDLYDMFANQASHIAILATSPAALAADIKELDTGGVVIDYAAAVADIRHIAIQNLSVGVLAESEYGDPDTSLTDWLAAGEYDGSETVEEIAAEWDDRS